MCSARGFHLDWDFNRYCQAAHYEATALRDQIYAHLPKLKLQEPDWDVLYAEKREAILELLNQGIVHLMPGVAELLEALRKAKIKRCVVTHSPDTLIHAIRKQNPLLDTIPNWITRENYTHPKPDPECYLTAINRFALPEDHIIGFEDTPRGLQALLRTRAKAFLICQANYPEIPSFIQKGVQHYRSISDII